MSYSSHDQLMKKISAISLGLLFLLFNLNISIGTHYCGGRAVKTEILHADHWMGCAESRADDSCESKGQKSGDGIYQKDCCSNSLFTFFIDDEYQESKRELADPIPGAYFLVEAAYIILKSNYIVRPLQKERPPPDPSADRQILFQTFLI